MTNAVLPLFIFQEPRGVLAINKDCKVSEIRADAHKFGMQYVFRIIWPENSIHSAGSSPDDEAVVANQELKGVSAGSLFTLTNVSIAVVGIVAGAFTSGK